MPVTLKVGGDNKEAIKVVEQLQKRVEQLEAQNRKLNQESKKGADDSTRGWNAAANGAANAIAAYVSLQAAIQVVNRSLQDKIDLENKSAQAQTRVADSQRGFLINLGLVSKAEQEAANARIQQISKATGASVGSLYASAGAAVSARGDLSINQALDAVAVAARVQPRNAGEQTAVAGGLLDLATLTGSADAKVNLGILAGVGSQARITNLQALSQNLVPGAINVASRGGTPQEALALVSTITSQLKDATGATSATAGIQLANQLAAFLPESDTFKNETRNGRTVRTVNRRGTGLSSTFQRIEALQNDDLLREQFLGSASFEQKAGSAIEQLLTKGSPLAQLLTSNAAGLPSNAAAAGRADSFIAGLNDSSLQRAANIQSMFAGVTERNYLSNIASGEASLVRQGMLDLDKSLGADFVSRNLQGTERYMRLLGSSDPAGVAIAELEGRAEGLTNPVDAQNNLRTVTDSERERATLLREIVAELRRLRGGQRGNDPDKHIEK